MNILMMTNTYLPHVGGVAKSVEAFRNSFRNLGHDVLLIAPEFEGYDPNEAGVVRIPAVQNFNGSDFSVRLPLPVMLNEKIRNFNPDIVHSHHPFLLGINAVRLSAVYNCPLIFTYHTMYENYTHYIPGDSKAMKRYAIKLATGYCNLCDGVIAPSETIAGILKKREVHHDVRVIPTGVDFKSFQAASPESIRKRCDIPSDATLLGFVSRLAKEKNLNFLCEAIADLMNEKKTIYFAIVGDGKEKDHLESFFNEKNLSNRVRFTGVLKGRELINAYAAFDLFCFASKSETQGMVLLEAMGAGTPAVALDAPGVRDVVNHRENGILVHEEDKETFTRTIKETVEHPEELTRLKNGALKTARQLSIENCSKKALEYYQQRIENHIQRELEDEDEYLPDSFRNIANLLEQQWNILKAHSEAAVDAAEELLL